LMGVAGVTDVLTLAHDPMRMSTADVLLDHFHKLAHGEVRRGAENGVNVHANAIFRASAHFAVHKLVKVVEQHVCG